MNHEDAVRDAAGALAREHPSWAPSDWQRRMSGALVCDAGACVECDAWRLLAAAPSSMSYDEYFAAPREPLPGQTRIEDA